MGRLAAILSLLAGISPALSAAPDDNAIIRKVYYGFSNGEQRLIQTMTAHPSASGDFQGGIDRVLSAKDDPGRLETEVQRFRLQWRGKIDDWARRYAAGDKTLMSGMSTIPRPTREEFGRAAPWMATIDKAHFKGQLYDRVIGKMNPYEAAYSIAGLKGLEAAKVEESKKKLVDNAGYGARIVSGVILDDTREKFQGDLTKVRAAYKRDKESVLAQLKDFAARDKLAKRRVDPETAKADGDADFDGAKRKSSAPPVVAGTGEKKAPSVGKGVEVDPSKGERKRDLPGPEEGTVVASNKPAAALKPPPSPNADAGRKASSKFDIPPPKTNDPEFSSRKSGKGARLGRIAKALFQKPAVAMGTGMVLGGLLGFLLGGPIGAAIGAALGAAGGGLLSAKLQD
jgi:hypothetical protein